MTLVSAPMPLMSLPSWSTISTSIFSPGRRAMRSRAILSNSCSLSQTLSAGTASTSERREWPSSTKRQAEGNWHMLQREAADCGYECGEFRKTAAVERIGALLFAQADREQLHQPGLDGPVKVGMGLDAIDGNGDVCFTVGCLIEPDRHAAFNVAEQDGVHVGADGAAHGLFGYAVMGEYLKLALCCSAAVAAHGGHYEGFCAELLDFVCHRLQHQIDAVDAAAAAG